MFATVCSQHMPQYSNFTASDWPGHPGVGVDVERGDGASEERRGFKQPHFHVGTGVPLVVPVLVHAIVTQTGENAYAFLKHKTGKTHPVTDYAVSWSTWSTGKMVFRRRHIRSIAGCQSLCQDMWGLLCGKVLLSTSHWVCLAVVSCMPMQMHAYSNATYSVAIKPPLLLKTFHGLNRNGLKIRSLVTIQLQLNV